VNASLPLFLLDVDGVLNPYAAPACPPGYIEYAARRPLAWIDDELQPEAHAWAASRGTPTLLISADPAEGLTRRAIDQALRWAEDQAAG